MSLANKILISDPFSEVAKKAAECLTKNKYIVDIAENGKDAQIRAYKEKYFAIILDIDTSNYSGIEVLRFLKHSRPDIKIVLTVESKERIEELGLTMRDLTKLGAKSLLIKPYSDDQLLTSIRGELKTKTTPNGKPKYVSEDLDQESMIRDDLFTKIHINEFYSTNPMMFDVYVKINPHRYVKIVREGDELSFKRIEKYQKEKNIDYLYFKTMDRVTYINHLNKVLKALLEKPNQNLQKKVTALKTHGELFLEELFTEGIKPELIDQGKQICHNVNELISQEKRLYNLMKDMQSFDFSIYAHSFQVAFLSAVCCSQLEWNSPSTIEKVAMGSILHDIGKIKLGPNILHTPPAKLNDEQFKELIKHPALGLESVQEFNGITQEVKNIIYQHHETIDAQGYPNRLPGMKIYPLAQIVGFIDLLSHIMSDNQLGPLQAFKFFLKFKHHLTKYNPKIIKGFANCLIQK